MYSPDRDRGARVLPEADELPVPHPDLQEPDAQSTAICRCASPSGARSIASSASGVLHGLTRVRGFTQDDAHLFCRPDQMPEEIDRVLDFCLLILRSFGFNEFNAYLSTRPETARGRGRKVGGRRARAAKRRWSAPRFPIRWMRAAARSTAPRST